MHTDPESPFTSLAQTERALLFLARWVENGQGQKIVEELAAQLVLATGIVGGTLLDIFGSLYGRPVAVISTAGLLVQAYSTGQLGDMQPDCRLWRIQCKAGSGCGLFPEFSLATAR